MAKSSKPGKSKNTGKAKVSKKKAAKAKPLSKKAKPKFKKTAAKAVAEAVGAAPGAVDVRFLFTGGVGNATVKLKRNKVQIGKQDINSSGDVAHFPDVRTGDVISADGACTGSAKITINTDTTPETPETFGAGIILAGPYLVN